MSFPPLFTPVRMGDLDLPNRIVMAPLTRMRAGSIDHVPTALQAEYYAQRASAGLIVAEATAISRRQRRRTVAHIRMGDGAYLYLIPQFFNRTNPRTDEYGGSIEN